jgi:hypothetical protein
MTTAFSVDIPRSTSEALLMKWKPGDLPDLLSELDGSENEYVAMAQEMMRSNGIDPEVEPGNEMFRRQVRLLERWERLDQDQETLRTEIVSLQNWLQGEVQRLWPQAAAPYTSGFKRFMEEELDAAQRLIEAQPEYLQLRRQQQRYREQNDRALQIARENNRLQKIAHLLRLGKLKAALEREGPPELIKRYEKLRECESAPF